MKLRTEMIRMILILMSFTLVFPNFLSATTGDAGGAGGYLRIGIGARPLGMGGSFVALSDDAYAAYWNPAGLTQLNSVQFSSMFAVMPYDRRHVFFNYIQPFGKDLVFGMSWIGFYIDEIEERDSAGNLKGKLKDVENSFFFSLAKEIIPLSLGANLKYLSHQVARRNATGFGLDIGGLLKPKFANFDVSLGFIIQDIGSYLKWNTESKHKDKFPLNIKFGGATRLLEEKLLLVCDLEKNEEQSLKLHIGGEYWLTKVFALRLGYDDKEIAAGAGFKTPRFCIDYGFCLDKLNEGTTHRLSFLYSPH